jgi:hypothetical protein
VNKTERLDRIAAVGCQLIGTQLTLAAKTAKDALSDMWVLGYCFGVFDALVQRAELDQYTEGMAVITIGFISLTDNDTGARALNVALDNQTDAQFENGNRTAGAEVFAWFNSDRGAEKLTLPMGLYDRVRSSSDHLKEP